MRVETTKLAGVLILSPRIFADERGSFLETYQAERYLGHGVPLPFVQDNLSRSKQGTIRGLHYQHPHDQGKLVMVTRGAIWDVAVDLRPDSPTCGEWIGVTLDDREHRQLYIPPGLAHGFCALEEGTQVLYKCTDMYHPGCEKTLLWNDPSLGIPWPTQTPLVSPKDQQGRTLAECLRDFTA